MTVLSFKLILALSFIFSCLATGVADTCPAPASTQCIPGLPGRDGQPGPPGPSGLNGHNGRDGATGTPGPQGPAGLNGTDGQQGPTGLQGPQGPTGPQGPQGPTGPQGPQGSIGEQGMKGDPGEPGPAGVGGAPGRNGTDGLPGPPGTVTDAVIEQLERTIQDNVLKLLFNRGITEANPATSCKEVYKYNPTALSGHYWVNTTIEVEQVFCHFATSAGTQGELIHIAFLSMC